MYRIGNEMDPLHTIEKTRVKRFAGGIVMDSDPRRATELTDRSYKTLELVRTIVRED